MTAQVRQASYTDYSNSYNEMLFVIRQRMAELQTALPVKVIAVKPSDGQTGFVDVQPLVQQISADSTVVDHGIIYNVPYFRLQGGINGIIIDPAVGDIGLCDFCSRDISAVKNSKKIAPPASRRMHSFSDAMYIGGFLNKVPTRFIEFNDKGINVVPVEKFTYNSIEVATINDVKAATDRAKAAEDALNKALADESKRAAIAEQVLTENLTEETRRALEEEARLQAEIDTEIARAQAAEATETAARIAADAVLAAAIVAETTRAQAAEATLTANLNTEITRAISAESTLNININNEKTRAEGAEATLSAAISTLGGEVSAGGAALSGDIAAETTRAQAAEAELSASIAAETTRAQAAEAELSASISGLSLFAVNQTWTDVHTSRMTAVTYTNDTGKPIMVSASDAGVSNAGLKLYCGSLDLCISAVIGSEAAVVVSGVIPDGQTYKITRYGNESSSIALLHWAELR